MRVRRELMVVGHTINLLSIVSYDSSYVLNLLSSPEFRSD